MLKALTTVMLMHLVSTALELLNVNAIMVTLETESLATTLTTLLLTLTIVMLMLHAVMKSETCNAVYMQLVQILSAHSLSHVENRRISCWN